MIPGRQTTVKDEGKRFYVFAPASVKLQLEQEAYKRGTDLWTLGGMVLTTWLNAGAPDQITPRVEVSE